MKLKEEIMKTKLIKLLMLISLFMILLLISCSDDNSVNTPAVIKGWFAQSGGTPLALNDVYLVTENTGYIIGQNGTILKTTNGGSNWVSQTSPLSTQFESISFFDVNNGYIAGQNGTVLSTTNGGLVWNSLNSEIGRASCRERV